MTSARRLGTNSRAESGQGNRQTGATRRWYCGCKEPPVLLGTVDSTGEIHLKARDRYWHVRGSVTAVCPLCGCEHALDPGDSAEDAVILASPDPGRR